MNKNTHTLTHSHNNTFEEAPVFDDLQPLFDDHSRRLDAVLDRPEARPTSLNLSEARTFRLRMARAWGILALLCIVVTISWGIALWRYNHDIYYRLFTLFLEFVYILITVESVATTLAILRHDPARVSLDCMLRYARSRRPSPRTLSYAFTPQLVIDNLKRTATIGVAASFTLVLVACATTVGDGHTITQDHHARIEAVDNVTHTISNIAAL